MPATSLQRGTELELTIGDPVFSSTGGSELGGEGASIARHNGFVIFVVGAVPGDTVRAKVVKSKKNYAEAKVVRVERPSPLRTQPRCKHFGMCGGCKWQHVDYLAQLKFKEQSVRDALERIGEFHEPEIRPILGAKDIFFYRNKMEYSFSDKQWTEEIPKSLLTREAESGVFLGLHVPQRYDKVLNIEECHLQSPTSNRILTFTREYFQRQKTPVYSSKGHSGFLRFLVIRQSRRTNDLMVNLVTLEDRPELMCDYADRLRKEIHEVTTIVNTINSRKAQIAYGELEKIYFGPGIIHERFFDFTFSISASSFFQTNTDQAENLYDAAIALADLKPSETVFDLYSGTGTIAICVSRKVSRVVGIESSQSAVRDAKTNAAENGVQNCDFLLGDLRERLAQRRELAENYPHPEVIIADPPRSGMHPQVVQEIAKIGPTRLVYISCNPTTQARDLKALSQNGFNLVKSQPLDMFPHTYHVENICLMHSRT